jgi:hypothetical protein
MTPADLRTRLSGLPALLQDEVGNALTNVAEAAAAETRRLLDSGQASPSPSGAPPATPSGVLAGAIVAERLPGGSSAVTVDVPYAADLEYGTTRMAARPFLRPAVANTSDAARTLLADAVGRTVAAALDDTV